MREEDAGKISFVLPVQLSDADFVVGADCGIGVLTWDVVKDSYKVGSVPRYFFPRIFFRVLG